MKKDSFWDKAGTRSVLASLVAILIGMLAGGLVILAVGLTNPALGFTGALEGILLRQYAVPGRSPDHDGPFRRSGQ